jgi:MFS family permease
VTVVGPSNVPGVEPVAEPPVAPVSLLRHGDFLRLWTGESVSLLGSQVSQLAIPLIAVSVLKATTFQVGLLNAVEMTPFILVSLLAGVWIDRIRRRPVLIVGDAGRAIVLLSIPAAYELGWLSVGQLYVVAFVTGVLTVFFDVAYQSYLPALIDRSQLVEGNAKLEMTQSGAMIAGPGLAGGLIQWLGAPVAILADAASFVVSALAVLTIRGREERPARAPAPEGTTRRGRTLSEIGEGLRYVLGHRYLRSIAGCTGTSNLFSSVGQAVIIVFMVRRLGLTAGTIGLIFAVANVGFLIGAVLSTRAAKWFGLGRTIIASSFLFSAGFFLVPWVHRGSAVPFLIAGQLITAIGNPLYNINQVSLRQAITPHRLQGRMNATMRFLVWGTMPVGSILGGVLGTVLGLRTALWIAAGGGLTSILWVLFSPVRSLVAIPDPDDDAQN